MSKESNTRFVKELAVDYGFQYCGISKAEFLEGDARRLESYLKKGLNGKLQYMENYFDLRTDPRKLVPGARSVISLMMNYYPKEKQHPDAPKISKYAYGRDYHKIIRKRLKHMLADMKIAFGDFVGRGFVDSAPVLDKAWARKSGLGWVGKNGLIISKGAGSYFFIASLIVDLEFEYDDPYAKDYCGTCTRCIDACPTGAIQEDKVINASKCISYFTIELKDKLIPEKMQGKFKNWMFGCDICQEVCPWNRFSKPTEDIDFKPYPAVLNFTTSQWEELTEEAFNEIFAGSALKRAKYSGIRRNLKFLKMSGNGNDAPLEK